MEPVDELRRENAALRQRLAELERALDEAEQTDRIHRRMISIVEASSAAIASTALDGTVLCWNAAAERLYGWSAGHAVGRSQLEMVPFDRLAEHTDAVARALRGDPVVLETRRRRGDGREVRVSVLYARLADRDGKPLGLATIAYALS